MDSRGISQNVAIFLLGTLIVLSGCKAVPITGRSQLNMVSNEQVVYMADQGFSAFMTLVKRENRELSASESPEAAATIETVRRVSDRIIDAAELRYHHDWETVVVKAKETNAFVMPNGKIVVFTGIIPVAQNEAGLAAVIGHEVGHVVARHAAERMSQVMLTRIALNATDAALAFKNSKYRPVVGAALSIGAQYGMLLPFSRAHESEADHIGLFYMAKAGYDPSEAIGFWERMERAGGSSPWQFLSTHPSPSTRRAQLQEWLPQAKLYYADRTRSLPDNLAEVQKARSEYSSKMALAPIVLQPSYEVGYWYRSKAGNESNPVTYRLDRKEKCEAGECLVIVNDKGGASIHTSDFALTEIRNANGTWTRVSPPLHMIRWPMQVGDAWSDTITIEQSSGSKKTMQVNFEVVSYESLKVPAGEFMAFKTISSVSGTRFTEAWYAPETRTFIRSITYDNRGGQTVNELTDFQKNNEQTIFQANTMQANVEQITPPQSAKTMNPTLQGSSGTAKEQLDQEKPKTLENRDAVPSGSSNVQLVNSYQVGVNAYGQRDYTKALSVFRALADQGNAPAQTNLGLMYERGEGVAKNDGEAVKWYRKAADQGFATAQFSLGVMYKRGQGVAKNDGEAVKWFRNAADQGYAPALEILRQMGR